MLTSSQSKAKWSLTQDAFEKLLNCFSSDRDDAGVKYEIARQKLVHFFDWRSVDCSEERADETMNRVARRIDEGQKVDNLMAYVYGVARIILKEAIKERDRLPIALDDAPAGLQEKVAAVIEPDARELCFDRCLQQLDSENRYLILNYYEGERRAKIKHREKLAEALQIPMNALRIRAHRIRKSLESCIAQCLELSH